MGEYEDFKSLKARLNLTNQDIADITGLSLDGVKKGVGRKNFNRWLKLVIWVYGRASER